VIKVTLENAEIIQGCLIGCMRTIRGKDFKDPSATRKKEKNVSQWHIDIEGACAEMAFAKGIDIYWSGMAMDTLKAPDVGVVQIRHTDLEYGGLILRPDDNDSETFALVTGAVPKFCIVGWICASDGKVDHRKQGQDTSEPYWKVPQAELNQFN